jgi:SAM-dependent methyltransferase
MDQSRLDRATSFGTIARDYHRFRPEPPEEALEWLVPEQARSVAEIGAGTGLLTRHLVPRMQHVYAIEPDARRRVVLRENVPLAHVLGGRGEAIPLPGASVDAVLAASSWHWVEQVQGFAEVARVLRPGGAPALMWTGPDRSVPWVSRLMAGGRALSDEEERRLEDDRRRRHRPERPDDAPFDGPERRVFRSSRQVSLEEVIGLPGTYNDVIGLEPERRDEFHQSLRRFVTQEVEISDGQILLPIGCVTWRARRA